MDVADQIDDDGPADQRTPTPILRDMAEHAVINLVPLARPGWKMADRDLQAQSIRQLLETPFPETVAGAIASASVRRDQQSRRAVVNPAAHFPPPAFNGGRGELGCVVVEAHTDPAFVAPQIIHTVGDGDTPIRVAEV